MTKLEKIIKEAQKMRKAHPKKYAKWTDYIKAASKSIAGYVGTKKTATTTTVNYTRKVAAKKSKPATQAKLFGAKSNMYSKTKSLAAQAQKQLIDIKLINAKKAKLNTTVNGTKANLLIKSEIVKLTQKYFDKYGVDVRPKY